MDGLGRYNRGIPLYQINPSEVYKLYLEIKREDSLIYVYDLTNLYFFTRMLAPLTWDTVQLKVDWV